MDRVTMEAWLDEQIEKCASTRAALAEGGPSEILDRVIAQEKILFFTREVELPAYKDDNWIKFKAEIITRLHLE